MPIQVVEEGTPGAPVVAVKRVNELDYYNLGAKQLADHVGLTMPKVLAVIDHIKLRSQPDYYKEIKIGKTVHKRYSQKAIKVVQKVLEHEQIEEIWSKHKQPRAAGD